MLDNEGLVEQVSLQADGVWIADFDRNEYTQHLFSVFAKQTGSYGSTNRG